MMNRFTLYCTRKGVFIYVHGPRRAGESLEHQAVCLRMEAR